MTQTPLSPTDRSTVQRGKKRAVTDRAVLHAILDDGLICHLSTIIGGAPLVLPTGYGREGDTLYVHGSTGALSLRTAATGIEVCVAVTLVDGIVYARSAFHHSMNYRSVVVHGTATPVTDPDAKWHALEVITENLAPGSWDYTRVPNTKEMAQTAVMAIDLAEAAVKVRTGPPGDDESDVEAGAVWAGVLPLRQVWGEPESCELLPAGIDVPPHVTKRGVR
ncbi:MAG TPA: pyridoxamine 5'-phosphate oxidase family protein [Actinokineospora sp.]|nr:pyridoxamine 5'-phosphate oxidase family protein [Actinokineospora sp.]